MTTVRRFEDLHTWQSARELVKMVYEITNLPAFSRDFGLRDQIRRAAVSVMSNIAEGFSAGSDAEFVKFLGYARRSNSEAQSQCYAALDQKYITEERFQEIYTKANMIERQINTLISYLQSSKNTGRRSAKDGTVEYIIN
jgi:four helix bundle protein